MNAAGEAWTVEDLDVFKRAYALSLELHRASLDFPKIEQYGGLADQLRRGSKSVCGLLAAAWRSECTRVIRMLQALKARVDAACGNLPSDH